MPNAARRASLARRRSKGPLGRLALHARRLLAAGERSRARIADHARVIESRGANGGLPGTKQPPRPRVQRGLGVMDAEQPSGVRCQRANARQNLLGLHLERATALSARGLRWDVGSGIRSLDFTLLHGGPPGALDQASRLL